MTGAARVLSVALALAASAARGETTGLEGYAIVGVPAASPRARRQLERTVRDLWDRDPLSGETRALVSPQERAALERSGIPFRVVCDDLPALLERQFARGERPVTLAGARAADEFFDRYHPFEEIVAYLEELAAAHPRRASLLLVGTTAEGRPIPGLRIAPAGRRAVAPTVVVLGGVHAREWIAVMAPLYLAGRLLAQPGETPPRPAVEWLVVPVANPDGYAYTWTDPLGLPRLWRKNRRLVGEAAIGVDLNRNWSVGWDIDDCRPAAVPACPEADPSSEVYRGPAPFSEAETRGLRALLASRRRLFAVADTHSFGQLILWPNGFTPDPAPDEATFRHLGLRLAARIAAVHGTRYETGPIFSTLYRAPGVAADWVYRELGALAFVLELRPRSAADGAPFTGFLLPESAIRETVEEVFPALRWLGGSRRVRRFPATRRIVPAVCAAEPARCRRRG